MANPASGFRFCVVAAPGCKLIEVDFCVAPEVKILKSDLTWVRADELQPNDEVVGFDEKVGRGVGRSSKYRASNVVAVKQLTRPRVRVQTTRGTFVVAAEHPLMGRERWKASGGNRTWIKAKDLRLNDMLSFMVAPWEVETTQEAGYLAGFFDGEGWVSNVAVGYGQNPGPTLDHVQELLKVRGHAFRISNSSSTAQVEITTGLQGTLRFLGTIRPQRLMQKARQVWEGRQTWGKRSVPAVVTGLELLGDGPVVAIETTTKTYISDGFLSHNSGIEGVLTGYFMGDPNFIRIAKLSMNAHLTSFLPEVNEPGDLSWPAERLVEHFAHIKEVYPKQYDAGKRVVYLTSYCGTPRMMHMTYPDTFPTIASAEKVQNIYFDIAPKLKPWQHSVQELAHKQGFLGGPARHGNTYHTSGAHPFGYRHFFFNILSYRPLKGITPRGAQVVRIGNRNYVVTRGEDAKRAVAFFPQSTAAGILKEAMLRLFVPGEPNYIGEAFYGQTPLRAPIHDALLLEVPDSLVDEVLYKVVYEMTRPVTQLPMPTEWNLGPFLSIGVEAKIGRNWAGYNDKLTDKEGNPLRLNLDGMKKVKLPDVQESLAADTIIPVDIYDEDEEEEAAIEAKAAASASG